MTIPTVHIDVPMDDLRAFCERCGIARFAFFGSVQRDDFGPESDIDVLAWFDPGTGPQTAFEHMRMERELAGILGKRAEVISYEALGEGPDARRRSSIESSAYVVVGA